MKKMCFRWIESHKVFSASIRDEGKVRGQAGIASSWMDDLDEKKKENVHVGFLLTKNESSPMNKRVYRIHLCGENIFNKFISFLRRVQLLHATVVDIPVIFASGCIAL